MKQPRFFRHGLASRLALVLLCLLPLLGARAEQTAASAYRKPDLAVFFKKLEAGQPVTVATLGGSITMHRTGWAQRLVRLIRESYPETSVNFVNAGISGTGSNLGVFRLERDIISVRPDLVVIEYAVNDGSTPDEAARRNLESIVTRLQALPQAPALVFLESASEKGVNQRRHNQVAAHYNLLDVDTQSVIDAQLETEGQAWKDLFGDAVHPNETGHEIYAQTLWQAMRDNVARPADPTPATRPAPITPAPDLILDGTLLVPNFQIDGWDYVQESGDVWWRKFYQGSLQRKPDATPLHLPFYGRTVGVSLLTLEGHGLLRLAVDGEMIAEISAHRADWFYSNYIHPQLFEEGWHVLSLVPVSPDDEPARVHLGYLLIEDQTKAPVPTADFWTKQWPRSIAASQAMANWQWRTIPAADWRVVGPFGGQDSHPWKEPATDLDRDFGPGFHRPIDPADRFTGGDGSSRSWQSGEGSDGWVDLAAMYGQDDRGVAYAAITLHADQAGTYSFSLALDYFAYVYVNGERVVTLLEGHGSAKSGVPLELPLQSGDNQIGIKVHAGSAGFGFRLDYMDDAGLSVAATQN